MKCPWCGKEVDSIYNMQEWMEQDMNNGNLWQSEYCRLDDWAQENYDEAFCHDCYEEKKKELLER